MRLLVQLTGAVLASSFKSNTVVMTSAMCKIEKISDLKNPNTVKVVVDCAK